MKKYLYIFTAVMMTLIFVFSFLDQYWQGFKYLIYIFYLLMLLTWALWLIYDYRTSFRAELDEEFKFFKAEKMSKLNLTEAMFEENAPAFRKEFNRTMLSRRWLRLGTIILFCVAFVFSLVVFFAYYL